MDVRQLAANNVYTKQLLSKPHLKVMNTQNFDISSKWIIEGFPDYVVGSDKEIYRLPFVSNKKYYELRRIKKQSHNRWLMNGRFWSTKQLKLKITLNVNPQILIKKQQELPF